MNRISKFVKSQNEFLEYKRQIDIFYFPVISILQNVVSLVTGSASGLGRATVERIVREGGRAVLCDLPSSNGAQVASELGENVVFAPTDVNII